MCQFPSATNGAALRIIGAIFRADRRKAEASSIRCHEPLRSRRSRGQGVASDQSGSPASFARPARAPRLSLKKGGSVVQVIEKTPLFCAVYGRQFRSKIRSKMTCLGGLGFSHDFNGLPKFPLNSLYFPAASDRGCHLCALALGISQQERASGNNFRSRTSSLR